jgi:hypothetical protein
MQKDTLSILTKAIHYIRQLKDQIAAVRVEKAGSATFLQQQSPDRPAVVQAAAAAPASSSSFSSINNLSCCSTRVAVRPAEAIVIADGASNSRDLVIDVKSRNNPQTLIHILSMVRDSALEVGSLSSDDARVIQGRMAFSLTVPVQILIFFMIFMIFFIIMSFFFFFFLLGMIFQPEISILITSRYQHLVSCHTKKVCAIPENSHG